MKKKFRFLFSIIFGAALVCLAFSFASNNFTNVNAFAYSSQIVLENSTFNMAGGTISNSVGDNGGAVYVGNGATFTMTGGTIENCSATNGGAVYIANGGTFIFNGGTIENCSATNGGAVYVASGGTLNYENNVDGFSGCGEDEGLHIYAEEGATIISPGVNINIYVDNSGEPVKTMKKTGDTYIIDEAEMPLDYEHCCGYFLDSEFTKTIKNDIVDLSNGDVNLYTKTANCPSDYFTYNLDSTTNTYSIDPKRREIGGGGGSDNFIPKTKRMAVTATNYYVIPKEYLGLPIVEVKGQSRVDLPTNSSVTLCDNITSIGDYAFYYAYTLNAVNVHDGITSIGDYAFEGCSGLTSVTIPNSVTSIGSWAFRSCSGLTGELIISDSVTSIARNAFRSCSGLTSVYIPSSVTTISASSYSSAPFYGCSSSLVIYTDVANASSVPSGWSTYWNYYGSETTLTVNYGYTLAQYKAAVGLTFAPTNNDGVGEELAGDIQVSNHTKSNFDFAGDYNLDAIINEEKEYVAILKENEKIA